MSFLHSTVTLLLIFLLATAQQPNTKLEEQEIIQRLFNDYDFRVRPKGTNSSLPGDGPVVVTVNIFLRTISKIDEVNSEYSTQITLREEWLDPRLAYKDMASDGSEVPKFLLLPTAEPATDQIWMPDTYFQNEKEARRHSVDKPNVLIRIHPDGRVLYSVRLSLVLSCPMSLESYPFDRHACPIDLASYAHTADDIKYEWKGHYALQQKAGLRQSLRDFDLEEVVAEDCSAKTNTDEYSCLRAKILLRREWIVLLSQLYIPSATAVIVSWLGFWLATNAAAARVTLAVACLIIITIQNFAITLKFPAATYAKAISFWFETCLAFIVGSLVEFAAVSIIAGRNRNCRRLPKTTNDPQDAALPRSSEVYEPLCEADDQRTANSRWAERIDFVARVIFPLAFACFNAYYWAIYLQ
ncbi:unnamed protein product [Bursaphelenchus xylophilus]|uniref:(pine wood nematode) hypothetical protein n=1 Tax=Bursaphelenchus xylophilus TaxID=6326 RepID=A0A1I7RLY6_BURXY|nr:unnamed protein product [Bursaphelenchus xylophilus]CAG9113351.1 unnamed protein product [Bursaphelenchus xylophilus]